MLLHIFGLLDFWSKISLKGRRIRFALLTYQIGDWPVNLLTVKRYQNIGNINMPLEYSFRELRSSQQSKVPSDRQSFCGPQKFNQK